MREEIKNNYDIIAYFSKTRRKTYDLKVFYIYTLKHYLALTLELKLHLLRNEYHPTEDPSHCQSHISLYRRITKEHKNHLKSEQILIKNL